MWRKEQARIANRKPFIGIDVGGEAEEDCDVCKTLSYEKMYGLELSEGGG